MQDFLYDNFLKPIETATMEFNTINTIAYAAIGLIVLYLFYKSLKKLGIEINKQFFTAILSFVPLGVILTVLVDAQVIPRKVELLSITIYPFVPPFTFATTFIIIASLIAIAYLLKLVGRVKFDEFKALTSIGCIATIAAMFILLQSTSIKNPIILLSILPPLLIVLTYNLFDKIDFFQKNAIFAQAFDGTTTLFALQFFNYSEQQVFSNAIISTGGPITFLLLKTALTVLAVKLLKKEAQGKEGYIYTSLIITVFGLAPAFRNLLRIIAGV